MTGARRIALSVGDPNGIGPEIVLKALQALEGEPGLHVAVFGPREVLARAAEVTGLGEVLARAELRPTPDLPASSARFGEVNAAAGESAVASATAAIEACRRGEFDAVVAGPHHETAIAQAGIRFNGYASLLARLCGQPEDRVFLMLVGGGLRIVHATLHESVATALGRLTPELVVAATEAGVRACRALGVERPRVALFGINPHASEGTLFGPEDARCTVPAARRLREQGLDVADPQGADVLLADHARRPHDLYVAMLHDQGHIPIKLLAPQGASAVSIGGEVLLASTGHGSAMDIAGTGQARPDALLRSLRLLAGIS
ncbi:PdxA family dehydrogenase [Ramlibacter rhizophilus]|uniref:4-hydroxythreonine-4-phosphate dehydrogenase n=1 Tax=Ramlibacter rhizophilus TaxID=1781167 RepID=A0A4Z0C1D9_9BURK|nr:4-hydroxythreonine-4-phosphate dehydrogenase PdxA [Ramlibacter rhizophilus]TFZ04320.1 4-hydroxythreonine-4-phosphate dehydrogenase [Ramlibacter rhizophilus]